MCAHVCVREDCWKRVPGSAVRRGVGKNDLSARVRMCMVGTEKRSELEVPHAHARVRLLEPRALVCNWRGHKTLLAARGHISIQGQMLSIGRADLIQGASKTVTVK